MLSTRLTQAFNLIHPIIQAPMAMAAGGALAAAVTRAGGLGLIGGGYGDEAWIDEQFKEAGNENVGCGLITWALAKNPAILDLVLEHAPKAVFLSFGDPAPFASQIKARGIPLICQIQNLKDARRAIEIGADVIVAQGTEAGGHGDARRTTFTLVPEVADLIAATSPDTLLCAAGGIADGRGLAASLMLGADGVLVGSRFWATTESLAHPNMIQEAMKATGDDSIRSSVMDIARKLNWPERYTARVLRNAFTDRWHSDVEGLLAAAEEESARWKAAWIAGDVTTANTFVGEVTGLLNSVEPAAQILDTMASDAEALMNKHRSIG